MHVQTSLSTRFSTSHNAHRVGLLITIAGERAPEIGAEQPDQEPHPSTAAKAINAPCSASSNNPSK